jgi:hypothetical protein
MKATLFTASSTVRVRVPYFRGRKKQTAQQQQSMHCQQRGRLTGVWATRLTLDRHYSRCSSGSNNNAFSQKAGQHSYWGLSPVRLRCCGPGLLRCSMLCRALLDGAVLRCAMLDNAVLGETAADVKAGEFGA